MGVNEVCPSVSNKQPVKSRQVNACLPFQCFPLGRAKRVWCAHIIFPAGSRSACVEPREGTDIKRSIVKHAVETLFGFDHLTHEVIDDLLNRDLLVHVSDYLSHRIG